MSINAKLITAAILFSMLLTRTTGDTAAAANTESVPTEQQCVSTPEDEQSVSILMYHSISSTPVGIPEFSVKTESFEEQMHYLISNGYTPIHLNELDNLQNYKKPIIITFDDGYVDNYTYAYPILKNYNIKATVFMVSGFVGSGGYLTKEQIAEMSDLVSFQSHTIDHCKLSELQPAQIDEQCRQSKTVLESITKKPVYAISYPFGLYNSEVYKIAADYYSCAVTTDVGSNTAESDRHLLKRVSVAREDSLSDFIAKLS